MGIRRVEYNHNFLRINIYITAPLSYHVRFWLWINDDDIMPPFDIHSHVLNALFTPIKIGIRKNTSRRIPNSNHVSFTAPISIGHDFCHPGVCRRDSTGSHMQKFDGIQRTTIILKHFVSNQKIATMHKETRE